MWRNLDANRIQQQPGQTAQRPCSVVSQYEHTPIKINSANNLQHLFPISSPPYDPIQSN